jgi:membrane-bound serine protease (ClpP class)
VIEFKGPIDEKLTTFFNNRFAVARKTGVDLLVIEIDSPGGLKVESLTMARKLRDCKWAYTVAIIENEAISGGALVALGCDEIHINPNAKFGDVGEIGFDSEEFAWRLIEPKIESYLSRDARDLAESKGRPRDLAEALVDKDFIVYTKPNDDDPENGVAQFQGVRFDATEKPQPPWSMVPESGPERFLTVSGQRAVELTLAQGHQSSREKLAAEFGFELEKTKVLKPNIKDATVYHLNRPFATFLLVTIGLIALYFELSAPGIGIGGLISGLCAILFFWSKFFGGTGGWLEVILFAAGAFFLIMELFIIPGFGVPGIAGLALMFASVFLASQNFVIPDSADQWNKSLTTLVMLLLSGFGFITAAFFITKHFGSLPIFNRLILSPPPEREEDGAKLDSDGKPIPQSHPVISVGDWGTADSLLRPAGRAKFAGRSFDVISDGQFIDPGTQVRVISIKGNIITVAEVTDEEPTE